MDVESLTKDLLDTNKSYLLDCGLEIYAWMGKNTSLNQRKSASRAAEEFLQSVDRPKAHIIRVTEGSETVMFRSKFDSWPQPTAVTEPEAGKSKVAALLKRQGVNVKGLMKEDPSKEEAQTRPHIDCTGNLQVWRVDGEGKTLLSESDDSKLYSGDCYIFQYTCTGERGEEHMIGTWFGRQSIQDKYVVPEEAKPWVMKTLNDQFRSNKSRIKRDYYYPYDTDEKRLENRPRDVPLEDWKILLKYWDDEKVKETARKNSEARRTIKDTHTTGPKSFAEVTQKMLLKKVKEMQLTVMLLRRNESP